MKLERLFPFPLGSKRQNILSAFQAFIRGNEWLNSLLQKKEILNFWDCRELVTFSGSCLNVGLTCEPVVLKEAKEISPEVQRRRVETEPSSHLWVHGELSSWSALSSTRFLPLQRSPRWFSRAASPTSCHHFGPCCYPHRMTKKEQKEN